MLREFGFQSINLFLIGWGKCRENLVREPRNCRDERIGAIGFCHSGRSSSANQQPDPLPALRDDRPKRRHILIGIMNTDSQLTLPQHLLLHPRI